MKTEDNSPFAARDRASQRWMRLVATVAIGFTALSSTACVIRDTYDQAVDALQAARADAAQKGAQVATLGADIARLNGDVTGLGLQIKERDARLADLTLARSNDAKKLDDLVALNGELETRLRSVGQSVEALAGEKGSLAKALADTRARLEELRKQQAAAEARTAAFRDLMARFRSMVDAGALKVAMRDGRMLLVLANDVLFDSGRADLKEGGKKALTQVASVLKTMQGRRFQVAGHTDNVKIQTAHFPSNWELSTARAVEVVKLLVDRGMDPRSVSAAGYGEFDPAATNDTPDGRGKNRRIEISLVPNLEELASVSAAATTPEAPPPRR